MVCQTGFTGQAITKLNKESLKGPSYKPFDFFFNRQFFKGFWHSLISSSVNCQALAGN